MTLHPFSSPLSAQLASLERGMALLAAFSDRYGDMEVFLCSPMGPSVYLSSTAAAEAIQRLGSDGWELSGNVAWKEVEGVRVELQSPRPNPQPFSF